MKMRLRSFRRLFDRPPTAGRYDSSNRDRKIRHPIRRQRSRGEDVRAGLVAVDRTSESPFPIEFRLDERGVAGPEEVAGFVARRDGERDGADRRGSP